MSFCFLYNVVSENYSVQNSPRGEWGGSIASSRSIIRSCSLFLQQMILELSAFHCISKIFTLKGYCTIFQHALKSLEIIGIVLSSRMSQTARKNSKGLKSYKEFKF